MADLFGIVSSINDNTFAFSFTTDMWTNTRLDSFMSLSLHVITEDGLLLKLVPFVSSFKECHTGKNIRLKLDAFMAALGIGSRSFTKRVVSDNASNAWVAIAQS